MKRRKFRCPRCGGSAFGSLILPDGSLERICRSDDARDNDGRRNCGFTWNERDDWRYMHPTGERMPSAVTAHAVRARIAPMAFDANALQGDGPWRIPDEVSFDARVRILMELARRGESDPDVRAWARAVARRVDDLADPRFATYDARLASAALAAVQLWPYRDERPGEQYQSVRRTLRTSGNCHDLAPLLVATLHLLGLPARVFWITQKGEARDHVTVEVRVDGVWCIAEPTIPGAALCENPYVAAARLGQHSRLGMASSLTARGVLTGQLWPYQSVVTSQDVATPSVVAVAPPMVARPPAQSARVTPRQSAQVHPMLRHLSGSR